MHAIKHFTAFPECLQPDNFAIPVSIFLACKSKRCSMQHSCLNNDP